MRNQFVGDVNDYHKYQLLNELALISEVNVCWMLNDDIEGQDSKFVKHKYSDPLSLLLSRIVEEGQRNVDRIENSKLIKVKHYYRQIEDICLDQISGILFFDPDNGLEVKSAKNNDKRYLYYRDIRRFISYVDILVYQHFPRVQRHQYIEAITNKIRNEVSCSTVKHFPKSMVDFILIKK
ncbi:hypothetical protein LCGC14_1449700 [marine sediment metagenome]|uniref:Uncharacterized protein n=1 Tax=marine sediment metagenome TaxID=412755 RepID=A0A0F9MK49_9ZZZZ